MEKEVYLPGHEIYHNALMDLLAYYAREYKMDGKNFIKCFLRFPSVRSVCRAIVSRVGEFECEKDFGSYCERFDTDRETLNQMLRIIYYITNNNEKYTDY